jgi:hypothetical protein
VGRVALTKAQRAARRDRVLAELRRSWVDCQRPRVELTLQRGRSRPRVSGVVCYVATSGAFVHLRDDDWPDAVAERLAPTLHVPVDAIRSVRTV